MSRRLWIALFASPSVVACLCGARSSSIDPANLRRRILIAERTAQQFDQLAGSSKSFSGWRRSSGRWIATAFRPIFVTSHDPSLWDYGRPWIQALNTGDARGTAYYETALPLQRPRQADLSRLPAAAGASSKVSTPRWRSRTPWR
jgi:hypothetical protein